MSTTDILEINEFVFGSIDWDSGHHKKFLVGMNHDDDLLVTEAIRFFDKDSMTASTVSGQTIKLLSEGSHRDGDTRQYWHNFVEKQDSKKNPVIEERLHPLSEIQTWVNTSA